MKCEIPTYKIIKLFPSLPYIYRSEEAIKVNSAKFSVNFSWYTVLVRIDKQITHQTSTQVSQQLSVLQQLENQVNKGTDKDINILATRLNQGRQVDVKAPQELKSRLLSEITKAKTIQPQTTATLADKRLALIKNSIKRLLGSLVSGVLFIYIWANTGWARRGRRQSR